LKIGGATGTPFFSLLFYEKAKATNNLIKMQIINIFNYYKEIVTIRVIQYAQYEAWVQGTLVGSYSTEEEAIKEAKQYILKLIFEDNDNYEGE
jgi:hypothetical protein